MKKYFIKTYGCQMNQADSLVVSRILDEAGFKNVKNLKEADVILILTCAVREHAERRALGQIFSLSSLKKKKRCLIGILGCMARTLKERLIDGCLKEGLFDFLLGPDAYRRLPEIIENKFKNYEDRPIAIIEEEKETYSDILPQINYEGIEGFVTIMRGCDNFCSYCIVPYVRGRERSRPISSIIKEIDFLLSKGKKLITLLGQNVFGYKNIENGRILNFADLLTNIFEKFSNLKYLHFLTSHPKDLSFELIEKISKLMKEGKLFKELHLPLQSGSNRILKLMNRKYTREEYYEKVKYLKELIPEISITTDLIVGFPTETEEDYEATLEMVRKIEFDFAYMFKYSERPYTKAREIFPKVEEEVKQERLEKLISLQNDITKRKNEEMINKSYPIIIIKVQNKESLGRLPNNKLAVVKEELEVGKEYIIKIIKIDGWTPIGEIIK
ncbi:MAG: tRNA (N6-isopentenyl adenosine(37)-C2)-methylthiotransferase MiaB [candidate division WOR-3 bacterium]|nr:tRNA (N6-isopentenyl adenosine(37)-C2)-methylthiotransferase MiaB [candidate division WOR-3 bacterium]MDW8114534.1 tRNA (N6-isopentenyl adenosine(37)-C2)-methylthiotransferase MiaB [candidate division WOR-3 bacterium]